MSINKNKIAIILLVLAAVFAHSQSVVSQISWPAASPAAIIGIVMVFGTGLGVLITFYVGSLSKRARLEKDASAKLFGEGCQRCRLTGEETRILRSVAAYAPDSQKRAHEVFDRQPLFERCIDLYVSRLPRVAEGRTEEYDDILGVIRSKLGFQTLPAELPLISTRNISIGQKVSLFPSQEHGVVGRNGKVTHNGEIFFTVRLGDGAEGGNAFTRGNEVMLAFLRQGDAAYSVTLTVREAKGAELSFFHTMKFARNQNRRYLRMEVSLPVKYRLLDRPGSDDKQPSEVFEARSVDIGGGGLCFTTEKMHYAGDMIMLTITVGGRSLSGIKTKILRVIPLENSAETRFKCLAQFVLIEHLQREHIVKFIFEKQRELLQMR